ncbi:MAG TPA: hypothetical protein VGJ85_04300 [Candidatus Nanopelagicaceae bacterium]
MTLLPWTLAWARLRNHSRRTFSIVTSVALALSALLALQGISHATSNSLVTYSLSKLPAGDRTLTLTSSRIIASPSQFQTVSTYLSTHLAHLTTGELDPEVLYHEISDPHGVGFYVAGIDNLAKSLRLTAGRLPKGCTPSLCEAIEIGGQAGSAPSVQSLGLTVVGKGVLRNTQLLTGTMAPSDGVPVLVVDGIAAASALPHFANLQGANAWVTSIDLARVGNEGADAYITAVLNFENQLSIDHPEVTLTWPQDALGEASDQAKGIAGKFVLLDFVVGALVIAFLILFYLRHRREHQQFRAGLSRIGTPKKTLTLELLLESLVPLALGAFFAFIISLVIPSALSSAGFQATLSQLYQSWPKYVLLLMAALGLIVGSMIIGDKAWGRQFVIAYLSGAVFLFAYFRQSGTHEIQFWLIPFAYAVIPSVAGYFALRWASSFWRNRNHTTYVLFREHLSMWQGVTAILTLASILAVIALSFESGISRDVTAKSRDQVPLDISLRTGSDLVRPLDIGSPADYEGIVPRSSAYPILRSGTAVRNESSVSDTLSLIGIPPAAMRALPDASLHGLASVITPLQPSVEPGVYAGTTGKIVVTLENIPKVVDLLGWFRTPRGTHLSAMFEGHGASRTLFLTGQIPPNSYLIAFEFRETSDYLSRRLHAMGEGSFSVPMLKGVGSITTISFDGHPQPLAQNTWHQRDFPYEFNGGSIYVRPSSPHVMPRVVVDPITASLATNGNLTLTGESGDYFQVRIGAVVSTFPSAGDRFVLMDLGELQSEIARSNLGATDPIEVWISTPRPMQYLQKLSNAPYKELLVSSQQVVAKELRADPVNVGLDGAYRVALLYALLLAFFMYISALPLLYREGQNALFQLEAGGVGPRDLRNAFRRSLRSTILIALLIGGILGLSVGHLFISASTPYTVVLLAFFAVVILSELTSQLFTRRFFAESTMVRGR